MTAVSAAFLGALVEVVEAFTIVLAVSLIRGWRPALLGTLAGLATLAIMVAALGPVLSLIPLRALQFVVGALLLLFGLRWLRKAILRSIGVIALHDEEAAFVAHTRDLTAAEQLRSDSLDWIAGLAALKAVLLEGTEVVFIVIAVGAGNGMLWPASLGALSAAVLVLAVGSLVHKPLSQVPENALKFAVGAMLSAFGLFWVGEGLGVNWPGEDLSILAFVVLFLGIAGALILAGRSRSPEPA
ncbi:MAG: TMEM165/GDT1 family protein [Hyphomicrobiales bacterium]|nr:TMEM165/GDT1 family protein [Hyphomicrobiales bacterium]MBV8440709.1 TMEM165/GDT1 family protein [Hyphomicrobiales bacterium]